MPPETEADERSYFWEQQTISAGELRQYLTFMGERECNEAVDDMAEELRGLLVAGKQVAIPTGIIPAAYDDRYKSDTYVIDNLLERFTPEERERYANQLILNMEDITETGDNLHVWLMDDLALSGSAIRRATRWYVDEYPEYIPNTQVRLIVAPKALIQSGLAFRGQNGQHSVHIPIHAYFGAHELPEGRATTTNGALITTARTAPLAGFGEVVANLAQKQGVPAPGLANVQRPYLVHDYRPEHMIAYRNLQSAAAGRKVGALATRVLRAS